MERIKHRVTSYWALRAEGFETQRLREYDSEKRERWLTEFRRYLTLAHRVSQISARGEAPAYSGCGYRYGLFCLSAGRRRA